MANIVLKTFAAGDEGQGTVTPQDDSLIYQNAVSVNGIFGGATVTLTGANTLHVASGFGIICGRFFEINESDISVQLSSSGTLNGRLKIHLDLNNADNPIEIMTETGATLPALSGDSNININGGAFDMELCTFSVNELTISSLVNTFPTIDNTSKQVRRKTAYAVNDFVLCQSASDALIFVCTTAGTTAIQEPTAYATVTDGNTVTDGTAVFKAVSVSGQITQISKIGNLSSLNTTDKSSAVAAINEVNTKVSKTEVLINNSGDAFSSSKTYSVGDLCIHDDKLYRCITACSAGSWATNQSCFTQDTLVNVANLNPNYQVLAEQDASQATQADPWVCKYDGYIKVTNSNSDGNFKVMIDSRLEIFHYCTTAMPYEAFTLFVKKGMSFYITRSQTFNGYIMFHPIAQR